MRIGNSRGPGAKRAAAICTMILGGLVGLTAAVTGAEAATDAAMASYKSAGIEVGANAGLGARVDLTFHNFTRDLPLSLRAGVGYASRDAGDALAARRVFINNNTNGTPQESGHSWLLRLDLVRPVSHLGKAPVNLGVGVRKAFFTGTFDYVGGNENFDVTCRPWGVGFSLDTSLAIGRSTSLSLAAGVDHYFGALLEGHDATYEPDGTIINQRDDYQWSDADDAINQPRWELTAVMGLRWQLGR